MNWQGRCLSKQARSGQTSRLYFKSARGCCDPRLRPGRGRSADTLAPTRARLTRRGHAGPRAGTLVWTRAHLTRRRHAGLDAGTPDPTRAGQHFRPLVAVLHQVGPSPPAAFGRRTVRVSGQHRTLWGSPCPGDGQVHEAGPSEIRSGPQAKSDPGRAARSGSHRRRQDARPPPSRVAAWPPTCPQVRARGGRRRGDGRARQKPFLCRVWLSFPKSHTRNTNTSLLERSERQAPRREHGSLSAP